MNELFSHANSKLKELGYVHIGMGHFAHNESNIMEQFIDKKLKRNIMGFTDTKSNLLIGLGVSAFSNSSTGHVQNEKVLEQYIHSLNKDMPPIQKSHAMTSEENYLTNLFEKIICENTFNQEDRKKILPDQEANFNIYLNNHFIEENQKSFIITDLGRYFLKNICQCWG
jgi:oxygen-independent coproporphyrinogen-3 oxidase